ncbi:MAG: DUF4416 family protein [Planctomycetota bacterium]|nr:DUF4416 family protein [Planctomycetota bacterium]
MAWHVRAERRIIILAMGEIRHAEPVKLFVGMLSAYPGALAEAEARLVQVLGPVDLRSDLWAHEFTEYYRDEMGQPLLRGFLSFAELIPPDRLATIKRLTNQVEQTIAASREWPVLRPVNLDPGYIAPSRLVLATTKDNAHRIYLEGGIYGEVTLLWRRDQWVPLEWTYPDYRTPDYHEFFTRVRGRLLENRPHGKHPAGKNAP